MAEEGKTEEDKGVVTKGKGSELKGSPVGKLEDEEVRKETAAKVRIVEEGEN